MTQKLFTYFGNKSRIASKIWPLFGQTDAYVEPFAGCAAMLLLSPYTHKFEAINDYDCYVVNAHRAVKYYPEEVKKELYCPRCEMDLHARHDYLINHKLTFSQDMLRSDPKFCDPELAAWWIWGINLWIGSNWCSAEHGVRSLHNTSKPVAGNKGVLRGNSTKPVAYNQGVLRGKSNKPVASNQGVLNAGDRREIIDTMVSNVFDRLVDVNILYGDFERVLTHSYTTSFGTAAVFLDPPYAGNDVYTDKIQTGTTWDRARDWFVANRSNPMYRIILCGEEKQWPDYPKNIRVLQWDRSSGYTKDKSTRTEMVWVSDHCLKEGSSIEPDTTIENENII